MTDHTHRDTPRSARDAHAILEVAATRKGTPYALPPDGVTTLDCSLYVLRTLADAGVQLPAGIRTAEQIRQACVPVPFDQVRPGDLLFFERTYDCTERPGPDGRCATHVGISLGRGTRRMWDANDARGDVGITDISTPYWQSRLFEARRPPAPDRRVFRLNAAGVRLRAAPTTTATILVEDLGAGTVVTATSEYDWRHVRTADGREGWVASRYLEPVDDHDTVELSDEPDHPFSFAELWPRVETAAAEYEADPRVMAGIIQQESGWTNWRVHHDGTGHGLIGLDDNGLLPDFERWSGLAVGRGRQAAVIPPGLQIRYLARTLAAYTATLGNPYTAARAWHRGEGLWHDVLGARYEQLIRAHVARLFR